VIADTAYDSDPLRQRLQKRGIELIVPYRENNQQRRYEDGRKLRRYKRRWIVERTNSWLASSDECWSVMSICSPLIAPSSLLLHRVLLDYLETLFMKYALVRDPFGEKTRGVVFDPGKDDIDPYLYFSAAPQDASKSAKVKFQLHHID